MMYGTSRSDIPFNATAWRQGDRATRRAMLKSLINSRVLYGKSHAEVETLLGPPKHRYDDEFQDAWFYNTFEIGWNTRRRFIVFFEGNPKQVVYYGLVD